MSANVRFRTNLVLTPECFRHRGVNFVRIYVGYGFDSKSICSKTRSH